MLVIRIIMHTNLGFRALKAPVAPVDVERCQLLLITSAFYEKEQSFAHMYSPIAISIWGVCFAGLDDPRAVSFNGTATHGVHALLHIISHEHVLFRNIAYCVSEGCLNILLQAQKTRAHLALTARRT